MPARAFVHKMFIKSPEACFLSGELSLYLFSCKVLRRRLSARDQKGTPVKIRDYPRSCKFYSKVVHSEATAGMSGGKAYNRNKSEDLPEYFCLIRSFRVKGDRINELVNCTWCVQGSGHLHAIYLICELP